jgi:RNA polymerase sigma-70 factor (ECF subfamily)
MSTRFDYPPAEESASVSPAEPSDEQLLVAYRDCGDRAAFEELVGRYERELYNYLWNYLGDAQMAEDVFQMTFLQVHTKCRQFDSQRRVRPWLYAVATHQAIDAQRRNRRHRATSLSQCLGDDDDGTLDSWLDGGETGPLDRFLALEEERHVRRAVERLPELLRQTVVLVFFQGMKYREAAEVLGLPVGTVKSRIHAAVLKLHPILIPLRIAAHG